MKERPNVVVTLLSATLVLPMAALSIAKELRRTLAQIKKSELPICRDCRFWESRTNFCGMHTSFFNRHEYCSKWEEA